MISFDWLLHFIFKRTFKKLDNNLNWKEMINLPFACLFDILEFIITMLLACIILILMGLLLISALVCTIATCGLPICLYYYHKRNKVEIQSTLV